jgi:glycosyltransferase involved in cell wall biosynthesis
MTEYEEGLVSIITPAHNAVSWLGETLASVRAQTWTRWEWIIADDSSTDGTRDWAARAAAEDPRVRLVPVPPPRGLAARARNVALREARGEFLAFLDADDLWHPEKLGRQVAWLRDHPEADGVCCWWELFGDPERLRRTCVIMKTAPWCSRAEFLESTSFHTSTLVTRRRCYDELGGLDEDPRLAATEDSEYFARLVDQYRVGRICETLSRYRLHPSSYTGSAMQAHNARSRALFEVLNEKGFYTPAEAARKRAHLDYEQGMINLFHAGGPFRRHFLRSLLSGHPPLRAVGALALGFLPAPLLRPVLLRLQALLRALAEKRR